jgi:hypothetical protein
MSSPGATRAELLDILEGLEAEEDALRARRSLLTYRLEQILREKERVKRHLEAASRRRGEGAA